jgi:hypothetical protein
MPSTKTWIWIILGFIGACMLTLIAVAGAGVYFVRQHIHVENTSTTNSLQAFETERARFKEQRPLLEMDSLGRPRSTRPTSELPTSTVKPTAMNVMVWDPDKERLVNVSLPFWLLKLGRRKIDFANGDRGFDMERLNLDVPELERIGPTLVLDFRSASGERVLVWTQ